MDPLIAQRREKIERLELVGVAPYTKNRFERTHFSQEIFDQASKDDLRSLEDIQLNPKNEVSLCGRIVLFRSMGKLAFGHIQDMKGRVQVCFQKDFFRVEGLNEEEMTPMKCVEKLFDLGDFIGVRGEMFETKHGEVTLFVTHVEMLSKAIRPLPEKFHGVHDRETCYRERNLDLMTNTQTFDRFKLRSKMVREIRDFFHEKEFDEVETRVLQPQAGGAMAEVFKTHHKALDHEFVLRISLELDLKMIMGGGFERIFEIGKNFRNEGIDPSHLQEFTMLEWYAAYCDIEDNKKWTEELFHRLCDKVFGKSLITVVDSEGNETQIDFGKKFEEKRFPDLIKEYTGLDMVSASMEEIQNVAKGLKIDIDGVGRGNLLDDIYKKTARPNLIQPTFVYDYPEELKPLARPNGDGTASCFQLVVNSWEIVNSYGELVNPVVQRQMLEDQAQAKADGDAEAMDIDEEFLKAMEHGFPPMTGSGFGIDRLITIFTGQANLRDTVFFPTMKPEANAEKKSKELQLAVALVNTEAKLESWQEMNTMAHLNAAFGARSAEELFEFDTVETKDKKEVNLNIQHAIIVKQIPSNQKIKELISQAMDMGLEVSEFTREMLQTSDDQKVKKDIAQKSYDEIEHLGVLLFGDKKKVESLTKSFDLWS